jgi:hypothetical protein
VRRADPAFPDLLPVTHRLGGLPQRPGAIVDPVEMRLYRGAPPEHAGYRDRTAPRRPVRLLVHAAVARSEGDLLARLVAAGCGVVLVLDDALDPGDLPPAAVAGQLVAVAPWLPPLWAAIPIPTLAPWRERGVPAGVLLALGPMLDPARELAAAVGEASAAGAAFVVAAPLAVPAQERHRLYDAHADSDEGRRIEDLLFHTDPVHANARLERIASRACVASGLAEYLPGPATSTASAELAAAAGGLLLWARRIDSLDGVGSSGWQLRRAARALLASGREPGPLLAEDNLRVIPGFTPWVEAFSRSLWAGRGEPWAEVAARWAAG